MASRPGVRIFTVAEANALLPRFNLLLGQQMGRIDEIDRAFERLRELGHTTRSVLEDPDDSAEIRALKRQVNEVGEQVKAALIEIEATGAVVKDVRKGLLDFHGRRDDRLVWLCWLYGESSVSHWHPIDQGFSARKPLERVLITSTLN